MVVGNFFTVLLGCQKELSQISCRLLIVNISIGFKIILKTTENRPCRGISLCQKPAHLGKNSR